MKELRKVKELQGFKSEALDRLIAVSDLTSQNTISPLDLTLSI